MHHVIVVIKYALLYRWDNLFADCVNSSSYNMFNIETDKYLSEAAIM